MNKRQKIKNAQALGWKRNTEIKGCWTDPQGFVRSSLPESFEPEKDNKYECT